MRAGAEMVLLGVGIYFAVIMLTVCAAAVNGRINKMSGIQIALAVVPLVLWLYLHMGWLPTP